MEEANTLHSRWNKWDKLTNPSLSQHHILDLICSVLFHLGKDNLDSYKLLEATIYSEFKLDYCISFETVLTCLIYGKMCV